MNMSAKTILIVEDSPVQAELLRRELDGAGYRVIIAGNGAEGLALAKADHPAAVVSDVNMPVMDGYAMCRAIRDDPSLNDTPVILLTMLSDPQDVIRGLEASADGYVTKPYNVPSLISRIESLTSCPSAQSGNADPRTFTVRLAGQTYTIDAHGPRILNLLISTYENAVLQNRELVATQQALEELNEHLEQKVVEKTAALSKSESRFRTLAEVSPAGILRTDAAGHCLYVNRRWCEIAGMTGEEARGNGWTHAIHPLDRERIVESLHRSAREAKPFEAEARFLSKSGHMTWVLLCTAAAADEAGILTAYVSTVTDISELKHAENEIRRVNWALRALSQSNAALVRDSSEGDLLQAVCDAVAGAGGYPLAWVAIPRDDADRSLEIAASAGSAAAYLDGLDISCSDSSLGRGPSGNAIRNGSIQIINDFANDATTAPWHDKAQAYELASSISLPIRINDVVFGVLNVYSRETHAFNDAEKKLFEELAGDLGYGLTARRIRDAYEENLLARQRDAEKMRTIFESAISALAVTVEMRDPYTAGHERRVATLAVAIGRELGLDEQQLDGIRVASTIHDIGKLSVPAEILSRPGRLSEIELEIVKGHAESGYEIVRGVNFPWPVAQTIRQHHERLDGSGYPLGLKGEEILIEARILAVADVVEAMSSHRPYRPALGLDVALDHVRSESGRKFDAAVVTACERACAGQAGRDFRELAAA